MILHRIKLHNYRGIDSTEVTLAPRGITLVEGPNEIGKSSLTEALGIIFNYLDSSRDRNVEAIVPTHHDAGPEIEVELETGRYRVIYSKRYRKRPETKLEILEPRRETRTGREAHDRMSEILDETLDRALFGALQVVQGERIDQPQLTNSSTLRRALDAAAGGAGTDHDGALFARVETEYQRYWTPSGQPHKARREKANEVRSLEEGAEELARLQSELEDTVRDYESTNAARAQLARELPGLEQVAQTSRKEFEKLTTLRGQIGRASDAARRAKAETEVAETRRTERTNLISSITEQSQALEAVQGDEHAEADETLNRAKAAEVSASEQIEKARAEADAAEAIVPIRTGDYQLRQDELQRDQLGERCERLEKLEARAREASEVLENARIDAAGLEQLRKADVAVETAREMLKTGGVKLGIRAITPIEIELAGERVSLDLGAERDEIITERTTIGIGEQLELTIEPGRGLSELRANLAAAENTRSSLLSSLGVENISDAVKSEANRREAERTLVEIDPQRRADLRDLRFDELTAKLEREQKRIETYLAERRSDLPLPARIDEARELKDEAESALASARRRLDAASGEFAAASDRRSKVELAQRDRASRGEVLAEQLADSQRRLAEARDKIADETLASEADRAASDCAMAVRSLGSLEASLTECNPEAIEAQMTTTGGALERANREHVELNVRLATLEGRLDAERESGFAQKLEQMQALLEYEKTDLARLERRARAASLLFERLRAARDAARLAYVQPLTDRIDQIGRIVYGDSFSVEIGEDLSIVSRTDKYATVPYAYLSGGAKEQLGILVRLAVARTVAEQGGVPVILDDTLGNTDAERLRAMCAVISHVARDFQILVLTCYPDRFRSLGDVRVVRLPEA